MHASILSLIPASPKAALVKAELQWARNPKSWLKLHLHSASLKGAGDRGRLIW